MKIEERTTISTYENGPFLDRGSQEVVPRRKK
jgi:hypothetical protein